MTTEPTGQALSFGSATEAYNRGRPEYPAEAVTWMLARARDGDVADVGAGTGKLTRVIAGQGWTVTAIDPDVEMLASLQARVPGVRTLQGSGEHLPLPDASVAAVTFGQAWHWVDPPRASLEVARVLRPGGVLGLIWNIRDETVPWVAALTDLMKGSAAEQLIAEGGPVVGPPFAALEHHEVRWANVLSPDDLVAMAASRSYVITATPSQRARILDGVRDLLATHPATAGRELIDLPYVTHAYRAVGE